MPQGLSSTICRTIMIALLLTGWCAQAAEQALLLSGSTGSSYTIEGSNNLDEWFVVRTVENLTGALEIPHSELDGYSYYRVRHAGSDDLRAVGLALFEEASDPARREELRLAARDAALRAIADNQNGFSHQQITELFSSFATQEAFNTAMAAADAGTAAGSSRESVDRILGVLTNSTATVSAADLDAIRALALSTGLTGGLASNGGSSQAIQNAVTVATKDLDQSLQDAAAQYTQIATLTATIAQLAGVDGNALLQQVVSAVSAAISSGEVANILLP